MAGNEEKKIGMNLIFEVDVDSDSPKGFGTTFGIPIGTRTTISLHHGHKTLEIFVNFKILIVNFSRSTSKLQGMFMTMK